MLRKILILNFAFFLFANSSLLAQRGNRDTVEIKTSAHCEFCEKDIVNQMKSMKGVKEASLKNGVLKVIYNSNRISADSLRGTLTVMGYDADNLPARNRLSKFKKQQCTEK